MPTLRFLSIAAIAVLSAHAAPPTTVLSAGALPPTTVSTANPAASTANTSAQVIATGVAPIGGPIPYGDLSSPNNAYSSDDTSMIDDEEQGSIVSYPPVKLSTTSIRLDTIPTTTSSSRKSITSIRVLSLPPFATGRLAGGIVVTTDLAYPTAKTFTTLLVKTTKTAALSVAKTTTLPTRATALPTYAVGSGIRQGPFSSRMFHVPTGTPNGVYGAYINENGSEVHERIDSLAQPPKKWLNRYHIAKTSNNTLLAGKTSPQSSTCLDKGAAMTNRNEILRAAYSLGRSCDAEDSDMLDGPSSRYAVSGKSIVYICDDADFSSSRDIMRSVDRLLQKHECKLKEATDTNSAQEPRRASIGYAKVSEGFCGYKGPASAHYTSS